MSDEHQEELPDFKAQCNSRSAVAEPVTAAVKQKVPPVVASDLPGDKSPLQQEADIKTQSLRLQQDQNKDHPPAPLDQVQPAVPPLQRPLRASPGRPTPDDETKNDDEEAQQAPPTTPSAEVAAAENRSSIPLAVARFIGTSSTVVGRDDQDAHGDNNKCVCTFAIERNKIYMALWTLVVAVAAFLVGYCGAGKCSRGRPTTSLGASTTGTVEPSLAMTAVPTAVTVNNTNILLHNTLGSDEELTTSLVGPGLEALEDFPVYSQARLGSRLMAIGTDPVARIPLSNISSTRGTLCIWYRVVEHEESMSNAQRWWLVSNPYGFSFDLLATSNDGQAHSGWAAGITGGFRSWQHDGYGTFDLSEIGNVGDDKHVCMVWGPTDLDGMGAHILIYLDGVSIGHFSTDDSNTTWPERNFEDLHLHGRNYNPTYAVRPPELTVIYDDLRLYDTPLPEAQVVDLFRERPQIKN